MANQTIDLQAKVYMYDLNNCAKENGFKADEVWELHMATDAEKKEIEKKYFPTIATKVLPEILSELFNSVKAMLIQTISDSDNISKMDLQYLIAFNPKRPRN